MHSYERLLVEIFLSYDISFNLTQQLIKTWAALGI